MLERGEQISEVRDNVGSHQADGKQCRSIKKKKDRSLTFACIVHQIDSGKEQTDTGNGSPCPKEVVTLNDAEMQNFGQPERSIEEEDPKGPFEIDIRDLSLREEPYPIDLIGRLQNAAKASSKEDHGDAACERYPHAYP